MFSNSVLIFCFVPLMTYFCIFMWPLSVAGEESGKYVWTACDVNPSHVDNFYLLIAFIRFSFCGLNVAW